MEMNPQKQGIYTVEELVHTDTDHTWRQELWQKEDSEIQMEMQSQLQSIIHKMVSDKTANEDNAHAK